MPRLMYQLYRRSRQYWYQARDSLGWQKNSISICSNSRERNVKFRGVISLRKLLPTCAMPKGILTRVLSHTFLKLTNIPWAVSGRRKAVPSSPARAPMIVLNIRLNSRGSVSLHFSNSPGCLLGLRGHSLVLTWSARNRDLHSLQSTIMSQNRSKCPEHFQTWGCMMIDDSIPTMVKAC